MEDPLRLLLFDIDGTLVRGSRQVREWFGEALEEVFGDSGDLDGYDFSGKIDPQIVFDLLVATGISEARVATGLPRVKRAYLSRLMRNLDRNHLPLLPHVRNVLAGLQARGEASVGLITGNWEIGARTKLACHGLNRFFDFGAFGDGQRSRSDLPPVALRRAAEATGRRFAPTEALIIGDSRLDVECARAHGIRSVGVATGRTPPAELESAGADRVISNLGELPSVHPVFRA